MKYVVAIASLLLLLPSCTWAAERVQSFESVIQPAADGSFSVTETITYDFGSASRHGIYRTLNLEHPQPASVWYQERTIAIDDITVTKDTAFVPVAIDEGSSDIEIKIGDPDQTITGSHTYTISYTVAGGYSYYETESPELYWNVTGNEWEVPLESVQVIVEDSNTLLGDERACYAGVPGTGQADSETCAITEEGNTVLFTAGPVAPGEEVTIAYSLREGSVSYASEEQVVVWLVILPLLTSYLLAAAWFTYRYKIAHRPGRRTVITQYEPYEGLRPMYIGVVVDDSLNNRDITAGLLYLAEAGFITIKKISEKVLWVFDADDYEVELTKPVADAPTAFHKTVLKLLFEQQTVGEKVTLKALKNDQKQQRKNHKRIKKLKEAIKKDVLTEGYFEEVFPYRQFLLILLTGIVISSVSWWIDDVVGPLLLWVLFMLLIIISIVVSRRRTSKGYEAYYHTLGFKEFLSVTGKQRFKFHNAPSKSPQQFLEYLPYAIALEVEEEWSEVFKDVTIPAPSWYQGQTASFAAADFTSDFSAFSSSFSSSTGSSGSSGSGSAGGGAGGGGGGSW